MPVFSHVFYYLLWRCYHTTCQNAGDGARPTSSNSNIRMVLNVTDGLGLVSLSPTACDSRSQPRLTLLPSSSLHTSVKSFYDSCQVHLVCLLSDFTPEELCAERRNCSLWGTHKLALHSACFCFQGRNVFWVPLFMCLVLSWCLCLLSLPVFRPLAQGCSTMSHQRWVCRETTKQVPPHSFVVLRGDFWRIWFAGL